MSEPSGWNAKQFVKDTLRLELVGDAWVKLAKAAFDEGVKQKITGDTSDGYHTFNELYEFRKLYNAALFNEWASRGVYAVHKSKKHSDGESCFGGGWFIVMATLPTGQISNHYELKDWKLFRCVEQETAAAWDGHTAMDVAKRLSKYLEEGGSDV